MFGLAPAPKIFTKLLKVPMATLRRIQIRIVIFIDDMLIMAKTMPEILMARDTTVYLLEALGFTINYPKSILEPTHELEFLGVIVNSKSLTFALPQDKILRLKEACQKLKLKASPTLRDLAKVMGRLRATAPAFSPAPLQVRNMQSLIRRGLSISKSYEQTVSLDKRTLQEISWWIENLEHYNGRPTSMLAPELVIATDASLEGWGQPAKAREWGGNGPTRRLTTTSMCWK